MKAKRAAVRRLWGIRHVAERASTFQKITAAILAAVALIGLVVTGVTQYAPWAWAGDVKRVEQKIDTLSVVVLQGQVADVENKIAALEQVKTKGLLTETEAEYLRAQYRRRTDLNGQLEEIFRKRR